MMGIILLFFIAIFALAMVLSPFIAVGSLFTTKKCPYCREKIKRGATICKFCHQNLQHYEQEKIIKKNNPPIFLYLVALFFVFIVLSKISSAVTEWNNERQKEIELKQKKIKLENDQLNFVDNKDGTITHKTSALVWQKCSIGQLWNGSTCTGVPNKFNWDEAVKIKSDFANKTDWRLPLKEELLDLIYCSDGEYNQQKECANYFANISAINTNYFSNTPNVSFWSSSPFAGNNDAWNVNFIFRVSFI